MKPTAYFLNTGRANTTDEAALIDALKNKRIAGAGLDVFSYEPLPPDNPLPTLKNVVLTPHNAGGVGGWHDVFERISGNLRRVEPGAGRSAGAPLHSRPGVAASGHGPILIVALCVACDVAISIVCATCARIP